ncbi:MAG: tetratricopeptide repeat protein, partial [Candidatus Rokubacteria bacterium]|nr:tetratricopeptide repeat protein [Candidatus Rokubacteria bacterium]
MSAGLALLLVLGWLATAAAAPPAPLPLELTPPPLQFEVHPPKLALDRPPLVPPTPPPLTLALGEPGWGGLPPWRTRLVKPLPSEPPPGQLACFTSFLGGPQALYDCGRLQFQQGLPRGDLREARVAFENLLRNAPTHPLAPAARYWLGEIAFRRDPLDRVAREEFETALRAGLAGELAAHARLGIAWGSLLGSEPGRAQAPLDEILGGPTAGLEPTARFLLALAHLFQGRPAEARPLLAELAAGRQPSPLAEEVRFWEGQALLELGEREPARLVLERFLAAAPPNHPLLIEAIVATGWLVLGQGGAQEAIQKLLWAEAISPPAGTTLPAIRAGLARAYLELGDWPRAREKARQLARDASRSPLLVPTYLRLADAAARGGLLAEAVEVHQEILGFHPRPPRPVERYATYRAAEVLEELGRTPEASRRYRDLADSGDGAVAQRARYRLGLLALRARQYAPARLEGERLLRDGVEGDLEEGAWLLVAEAAASVGDLGRTAEALRHHLRRFPDSPPSPAAHASLAFALERLGEPGEALRLWEAAAASGDRALTGTALLAVADLATRRGDRDRAIEALGRFLVELSGDPLAEVAGLTRAVLLLRAERFGEAAAQLRALLVRFPLTLRQGEIRRALGLALFRQQRFEEALAEFRQAGRLSPTGDPEVWYAAGLAALHLGRLAEAEEAFNRARRTAPRPLDLAAEYGLAVAALGQ